MRGMERHAELGLMQAQYSQLNFIKKTKARLARTSKTFYTFRKSAWWPPDHVWMTPSMPPPPSPPAHALALNARHEKGISSVDSRAVAGFRAVQLNYRA